MILVKNSRMCRTGVLQDPVIPLRLWPRVVHDPHTAHSSDVMGTEVFTKPLTRDPRTRESTRTRGLSSAHPRLTRHHHGGRPRTAGVDHAVQCKPRQNIVCAGAELSRLAGEV